MFVGKRCIRCIAFSLPFPATTTSSAQNRPRLYTTSPHNLDSQSVGFSPGSDSLWPGSPHSTPPSYFRRLRMALDSLADDLLMLSHIISQKTVERQLLLNRKSSLFQKFKRTVEKDKRDYVLSEISAVSALIKAVEGKLLFTRQRRIPASYYVRLRRLHGHLPYPQPRRPNRKDDQSTLIRRSNATLIGLLSVPGPGVLQELAHFLLTTSLPITETSFLIMIRKLSALRLGSAARSAYHSLIAAGYSPTSPRALSFVLKLMPAIRDRREFLRLQTLLDVSNIPRDTYLYTQLIIGNLKMGSPTKAFQQFRAMISNGIQPTLQALTALLHDCGSRRNWQLGVEVWRALRLGEANMGFRIDLWAYQEMWRLCRKCGQAGSARQIMRAAEKDGFELEDLIHSRGRKTKSLAIRATNKMPELHDLENSRRQPPLKVDAFTMKVLPSGFSLPSRARIPKPAPGLSLKPGSNLSQFPSSPYSQAVERMMRAKYPGSNKPISSSWMEESYIAVPLTLDGLTSTDLSSCDFDDHLSDILREASETFSSDCSVLSTTEAQTLKSRLWLKYIQRSGPEALPPTPVDVRKHSRLSQQSSAQPSRNVLPPYRKVGEPGTRSHIERSDATRRSRHNKIYRGI